MPGRGHRHDLAGVPIVVVENVQDYRNCASQYLHKEDVVLELGCAQGCTTAVFARYANDVVGSDHSDYQLPRAAARYPHITFVQHDAFDVGGMMKKAKAMNKKIADLVFLLDKYELLFRPRLFIVKSYKLLKLVSCSSIFTKNVTVLAQERAVASAPAAQQDQDQPASRRRKGTGLPIAPILSAVAAFTLATLLNRKR